MEKDKIGAILKARIKECGYTQEDFAEQTGVGLSSLKKYISGANYYDIEVLERFADTLKCSYDYLLGKTATPEAEYRTIKDATGLADGSIERLIEAAKSEDTDLVCIFDYLLQNDKLVDSAQDYISILLHEAECADEPEDLRYIMLNDNGIIADSMRLGDYRLRAPDLSAVYLANMVTAFQNNIEHYGESLPHRTYMFKGQKIKKRQ